MKFESYETIFEGGKTWNRIFSNWWNWFYNLKSRKLWSQTEAKAFYKNHIVFAFWFNIFASKVALFDWIILIFLLFWSYCIKHFSLLYLFTIFTTVFIFAQLSWQRFSHLTFNHMAHSKADTAIFYVTWGINLNF